MTAEETLAASSPAVTADPEPSASSPVVNDADPTTAETTQEPTEKPEEARIPKSRLDQEIAKRRRLEAQLADLSRQNPTPAASSPATAELKAPEKPKSDQFKSWEEYDAARDTYFEALADYKAKVAVRESQQQQQQQQYQQQVSQRWSQQMVEAEKKHADFHDVVFDPTLPLAADSHVFRYLQESENAAEVIYALAQDTAELARINRLAPVAAMRELAILELSLTPDEAATSDGKAPETVSTRAPKPPTPITKPSATDSGLHDNLSPAEWVKRREAQLARKNKA